MRIFLVDNELWIRLVVDNILAQVYFSHPDTRKVLFITNFVFDVIAF